MGPEAAMLQRAALGNIVLIVITMALFVNSLRQQLQAERKARDSVETLALAFRISPHLMMISRRRDARIVAVNNAFRRQHDVGNEDPSAYTTLDVGAWKSAEEREAALRECDAAGRIAQSALPEEGLQIQSRGEHGERAVRVARPLVARAVPIELEPVTVRITEVNCLANSVVRCAVDIKSDCAIQVRDFEMNVPD